MIDLERLLTYNMRKVNLLKYHSILNNNPASDSFGLRQTAIDFALMAPITSDTTQKKTT